jgi:hypothetical protein
MAAATPTPADFCGLDTSCPYTEAATPMSADLRLDTQINVLHAEAATPTPVELEATGYSADSVSGYTSFVLRWAAAPTPADSASGSQINVLHAVAATLTPVELVAATPTPADSASGYTSLSLYGSSYADVEDSEP